MKRPPASSADAAARMKRQRLHGTKPELRVRRLLHQLGFRYRTKNRDLPGSPDLANRKRRWAVFVHGCYWHHHEGCPRATIPKANSEFWMEKFRRNRERDRTKEAALEALGYHVVVVWECELREEAPLVSRLRAELEGTR